MSRMDAVERSLLVATILFLLGSLVAQVRGEIVPRYELVAPPRGVPAVRQPRKMWFPPYREQPPVARLGFTAAPTTSLEPGRFLTPQGISLRAGETLIAIDGRSVAPPASRSASPVTARPLRTKSSQSPIRRMQFNFSPASQNCGPLG